MDGRSEGKGAAEGKNRGKTWMEERERERRNESVSSSTHGEGEVIRLTFIAFAFTVA